VVSHDIDLTPTDEGFTLVNDQVQNTAGLPAIAKKIAGDTTRAVIEEHWTSHAGGTVSVTAPGKPTTATGTVRLEARGAGTAEVVDGDAYREVRTAIRRKYGIQYVGVWLASAAGRLRGRNPTGDRAVIVTLD